MKLELVSIEQSSKKTYVGTRPTSESPILSLEISGGCPQSPYPVLPKTRPNEDFTILLEGVNNMSYKVKLSSLDAYIGIDPIGFICEGYDTELDEHDLSKAEKIDLANIMILRWQKFKARA
jgi:hypothetical protein